MTNEPRGPRKSWAGAMLPRPVGEGRRIKHSGGGGCSESSSVRLQWCSRDTDAAGKPKRVRKPWGIKLIFPDFLFFAAGLPYLGRRMLAFRQEKNSPWARDIYGRDVLVLRERFPCFDSADRLHEKRYFRWYFLCRHGRFTCVYHTDKTPFVTGTEDVLDVEDWCWRQIRELAHFE